MIEEEKKQGGEEIRDDNSLETIDENNEFTPRLFETDILSARLPTKANGQVKGESQLLIEEELPNKSYLLQVSK